MYMVTQTNTGVDLQQTFAFYLNVLKVYVQVAIFDEEVFNTISPQYDTEHGFRGL